MWTSTWFNAFLWSLSALHPPPPPCSHILMFPALQDTEQVEQCRFLLPWREPMSLYELCLCAQLLKQSCLLPSLTLGLMIKVLVLSETLRSTSCLSKAPSIVCISRISLPTQTLDQVWQQWKKYELAHAAPLSSGLTQRGDVWVALLLRK